MQRKNFSFPVHCVFNRNTVNDKNKINKLFIVFYLLHSHIHLNISEKKNQEKRKKETKCSASPSVNSADSPNPQWSPSKSSQTSCPPCVAEENSAKP